MAQDNTQEDCPTTTQEEVINEAEALEISDHVTPEAILSIYRNLASYSILTHKRFLSAIERHILNSPYKDMSSLKILESLFFDMAKNTFLNAPKKSIIQSIMRSIIQSINLGLIIGETRGECYLVQYGDEAKLIIGYKGILKLAQRTGAIKDIYVNHIVQGDDWRITSGDCPSISHEIKDITGSRTDPDNIIAFYAIVNLLNGGKQCSFMTMKDLLKTRKTNTTAWKNHFIPMAYKTILKQALKYVPQFCEIHDTVDSDIGNDAV